MGTDRENHDGVFSFDVADAIPEARLVKADSGTVVSLAGLTEKPLGVTTSSTFAAGEGTAVKSRSKPGTVTLEANGAIPFGSDVYGAADGKGSASSAGGAVKVGTAMESADADGDYFQVMLD